MRTGKGELPSEEAEVLSAHWQLYSLSANSDKNKETATGIHAASSLKTPQDPKISVKQIQV